MTAIAKRSLFLIVWVKPAMLCSRIWLFQDIQSILVFLNKTGNVRTHATQSARSRNHFCRGKAMGITYSKYVSVALGIQHEKRISGLSGCTIFLHFTS